jgi:cell division protein FtsQ
MTTRSRLILKGLGTLAAAGTIIMALGFVDRSTGRTTVEHLDVRIDGRTSDGANDLGFVDEALVERAILDQGNAVMGAPLASIDLAALESRLRAMPTIADADVFHTMDGTLHVKVRQREPIARIINSDGSGFYIDRDGWTMPLSDRYTARVMVVTGDLQEPGAVHGVRHAPTDSLAGKRTAEIYRLAAYIHADPLWRALVDQVVVDGRGQYTLISRVGGHRVLIGEAASWNGNTLAKRFGKLHIYYTRCMSPENIRTHSRIDLRFTDQIVCTNR